MHVLFGLLLLLVGAPSVAAAQDGPATRRLRDRHAAIERLAHRSASAARDASICSIVDELFDFEALAANALGATWGEMTPISVRKC